MSQAQGLCADSRTISPKFAGIHDGSSQIVNVVLFL